MHSRLQRTKGYFFIICFVMAGALLLLSYSLLSSSPYVSIHKLHELMSNMIGQSDNIQSSDTVLQLAKLRHKDRNHGNLNKQLQLDAFTKGENLKMHKNLSNLILFTGRIPKEVISTTMRTYIKNKITGSSDVKRQHSHSKSSLLPSNMITPPPQKSELKQFLNPKVKTKLQHFSNYRTKAESISIYNTGLQESQNDRNRRPTVKDSHKNMVLQNVLVSSSKTPMKTLNHKDTNRDNNILRNTYNSLPRFSSEIRQNLGEQVQNLPGLRSEIGQRIGQVQAKVLNELKNLGRNRLNKFHSFSLDDYTSRSDVDADDEATTRPETCASCFKTDFEYIINQKDLCRTDDGIDLLIFVSSAPGAYDARTAIRSTWGSLSSIPGAKIKCVFVVGETPNQSVQEALQNEAGVHRDIIQLKFVDSYANLTYKTLSGLKWTTQFCRSAKFVMKTDDDMFINTELIPIMLQAAPETKFMGGYCWGMSTPNRENSSKWYVSYDMYSNSKFPPMCSGTGYIMSMDVARGILAVSKNVPFFYLEDVYIAICVQQFSLLPKNIMGFSNMFVNFEPCYYRNRVMTSHEIVPSMLTDLWKSSQQCELHHADPRQLFIQLPYPSGIE